MEALKLTRSEKKIVAKIRAFIPSYSIEPYYFCFVYHLGKAINWEGGFGLPTDKHFCNQYTIQKNKPVFKNWD